MADKGLFDEFDPFAYKKNVAPTTPMMPTLSREDKERMDESFFETFETSQHMETSEKQDMHMVYDMVESLRIECAEMRKEIGKRDSVYADLKKQLGQRDSAREKDMQFLIDKIDKMAELTSYLLDRKTITDNSLSKEQSKLADLEVTTKKKPTSKTVSFKSDEAVHEDLVGSKELGSKIVTLKPNDISSEKKAECAELGKKGKNFMKPATFDGSSSWIDYKSHFDMCAELNGWTHDQKGLYLGVSLRGLAQGVLVNLPTKDQKDFETLCNTLGERFSPESQTELYRAQLKEREWKHGENLGEFSQRILRLTTLAYPRADPTLINVLAMGFFIDSISDAEMRLKIQQTRPKDLNEAVKVAVELEAFDRAERQRRGFKYGRQTDTQCEEASDLKKILNIINEDKKEQKAELRTILEQVSKLSQEDKKKSAPSLSELVELINQDKNNSKADKEGNGLESKTLYQNKPKRRCYICNDESHLANRCPVKPKCFNCQEIGHKSFECPQKRSMHHRGQTKDQKQVKRSGSNFEHPINLFDAGIYCYGVINGVGITALVDSGATATMVSDTVYSKLPSYKRPLLEPVGCKMIAANGQEMTTFGVGTFTLSFNGKQFELPAIVADMNSEVVLGADFLQKFSCILDVKNCTVTTEDLVIDCFMKGNMSWNRITAADTVSSPSNHEIDRGPGKRHPNAEVSSRIPVRKEKTKTTITAAYVSTEQQLEDLPSLKEAQQKDREIKLVREWVEKGERPPWTKISGMNNRVKSYWSQFQRLCIYNDYLCRIWFVAKKPEKYQIIIPKGLTEIVLQQCHDSVIGGHLGVRKTLEKVRQKYYWAGLFSYVEQYVKSCDVCGRGKPSPKTRKAPVQLTGAGYPMGGKATDVLEKYSDLTYKVRNKATGFQKVVHVDRMKRKCKRGDSFQKNNIEKVGTQETDKSSNIDQEVVDEIEEVYYDAEEYVEVAEELGRGKRQKQPPQRFTDYVL